MLVSFKIKNWCSFKEEASFSMENSKERRFSDTLINLEDSAKSSLLPITAIYGYNASGKSSFFKALKFIFTLKVLVEGQENPTLTQHTEHMQNKVQL